MTSSSSYAPLFLIALLLFSASTPLPALGQIITATDIIPLVSTILSNLGGIGNLLPQLNLVSLITRILGRLLPVTLEVVGRVTACPGQLPVNLTCVTNGVGLLGGQTISNPDGSFAVNATLSPLQAVGLVSNLLPNNTLPCLVLSCPGLTNTTAGSLVSLVQFTQTNVFSALRRHLTATTSVFI